MEIIKKLAALLREKEESFPLKDLVSQDEAKEEMTKPEEELSISHFGKVLTGSEEMKEKESRSSSLETGYRELSLESLEVSSSESAASKKERYISLVIALLRANLYQAAIEAIKEMAEKEKKVEK